MTFTGSNIPYLFAVFIGIPVLVHSIQWIAGVWP